MSQAQQFHGCEAVRCKSTPCFPAGDWHCKAPLRQQVQEKLRLFQQKSTKPGEAAPDFQQAALSLGLHPAPGAGSALSHLIAWAGEQPGAALFLTHLELRYRDSNYGSDSRKSWELGQDTRVSGAAPSKADSTAKFL